MRELQKRPAAAGEGTFPTASVSGGELEFEITNARPFDSSGDEAVGVEELVQAVNASLRGRRSDSAASEL